MAEFLEIKRDVSICLGGQMAKLGRREEKEEQTGHELDLKCTMLQVHGICFSLASCQHSPRDRV